MSRVVVVVVVIALSGCGPSSVRCGEDGDCPASAPFCVETECAAVAPAEPPECAVDADCGRDLCFQESCVPGDDVVDDCASARLEEVRSRDDGGPALFAVSLAPGAGNCSSSTSFNLRFSVFDREGDMVDPTEFVSALFVRVDGEEFASASAFVGTPFTGDDPTETAAFDYEDCRDPPVTDVALWIEDAGGHRSNVVCALP
ncbi:MAG: hypothetical protein Q8O67_28035 [Deltaproteobacteria bacterium]|nr:hypothetical protein [Deltaproteobacteria bacterium]